jgi:hypothetical protein
MDGQNLILGRTNEATNSTILDRSGTPTNPRDPTEEPNNPVATLVVKTQDQAGVGIVSSGKGVGGVGVLGKSELNFGVSGKGVVGVGGASTNIGTFGSSGSGMGVRGVTHFGIGVDGIVAPSGFGRESGIGVHGKAILGPGVFAESEQGQAVVAHGRGIGVYAFTGVPDDPEITGDIAVYASSRGYGTFASGASVGVHGRSQSGDSVFGLTVHGVAIRGDANGILFEEGDGIGVYGTGGINPALGGLAARFDGPVEINGSLTVLGQNHKAACVQHPDGSQRLLYSMESPESWFEDFGEGMLENGKASVALDEDFAYLVHTDKYHVFLTPHGDSNGLYVSRRSTKGFEVHEQKGGTSSLTFSYRVVAKRKDIKGQRLAKVTPSQTPKRPEILKEPELPQIKESRALPNLPELLGPFE